MDVLIVLFVAFTLLPLTLLVIGKTTERILLFINREKYTDNAIDAYMLISYICLLPCVVILPLFLDFNSAKAYIFFEKVTGYCSTQIIINLNQLNAIEQKEFIQSFSLLLTDYQREISTSVSGNKGYSNSVLTAQVPVYYTLENNQLIIQLAGKVSYPPTSQWLRNTNEDIQVNQIAQFSPWFSSKKWNALPISTNSRNLVRECD